MSVDKKETVTAFQACTGIEDVLLAILYLEDAKWDLSAAIQRMVLPEYKVFPKRPLKPRNKLPVNPNPIDPTRIVKYKQVALKPIRCRYLKFVVSFEDKVIRFKMPDCSNFSHIKHKLARDLKIPVSRQKLTFQCKTGLYQNVPFSYLFLPPEVDLILVLKAPLETNV